MAIKLSRNFGQHNALLCGIRAATKEICITIDDDMQHPPSEIKILLGTLKNFNADLVYGNPKTPRHKNHRNISLYFCGSYVWESSGSRTQDRH